ncbi:MAG: hypothetical protein ACLQBA_16040 [Candidatus Binataceae bacterium]
MNSRCLKTAGIAIVIGKFIFGCAPEKRFETPEGARITTDVRGFLAPYPDPGPFNSIQVITIEHVVHLSDLVSGGLGDAETEEIARQAPQGTSRELRRS